MGIPILKEKRKNAAGAICVLVITLAGIKVFSGGEEIESNVSSGVVTEFPKMYKYVGKKLKEQVLSICAPAFSFVMKDNSGDYESYFEEALLSEVPFFSYAYEEQAGKLPMQDETTWQSLLSIA